MEYKKGIVKGFMECYAATDRTMKTMIRDGKLGSGELRADLFNNEIYVYVAPIVPIKKIQCTVTLRKPFPES